MREEQIEKLRGVVRDCVSKHLYSSAIFFADKVAAVTADPADIYMQAQALYLGRHYRRAFHLLNASQIVLRDLRFRYLAAKCLEELKEWDQCLLMLGDAKVDEHGNITDTKDCSSMSLDKDGEDREINIISAICFLRGKAYEALENRAQARLWYKAAIKADPLCYEALECLIEGHMLSCEEETSLLATLQFGPEDGWLSSFYSCLVKKYEKENVVETKFRELEVEVSNSKTPGKSLCTLKNKTDLLARKAEYYHQCGEHQKHFELTSILLEKDPFLVEAKFRELEFEVSNTKTPEKSLCTLKNNTDLLACKAEYYHQCGEYQKCFELTSILLEKDPFHLKCTLVHLAAAMELGHSNELYLMACNLVKDYPQKALSWFAVGCYYYCIKKYDQSRRYFSKATSLDGTFAPGWIGYGNAYAAQEEGDQAMSAYRTAARLFPGCHLPALYIGMEYMRTHSFKLAEQFFMQAQAVCPSDPLVYNELGVVAYHMKEYKNAVWWFEKTLANVPSSLSEMWEPTLVNLAHALRKLKRYNEAIVYYEKALALSTRSLSTYAGLAYTYHLQDNFTAAITHYHKALWIKPDDQFCTEMLTLALQDECQLGTNPKVGTVRSQLFT
ncbi:anaphase-promoting complex subunit 6 [Salvia miltiorrhiza]|uniref:anaphase-promoting complex subunit 6 n=1 Tax=Salvia miltiorrhiza TaxID=226208 RepID=UPI0025AC31D7|nr:anaphase-promoting complex subunit 6 [Salvia miltiorrhiza]